MKRPLVLIAAFVFFAVAALNLGTVRANPSNAPQLTTTASLTPTPTETGTATASPTLTETASATATPASTTDPCSGRPQAPTLKGPKNKRNLSETSFNLRWLAVECAAKYRYVVRLDSKKGQVVMRGATNKTRVKTIVLARGHTYFWSVKACANGLCARSETWRFTLPAPPTPTPRPTSVPQPTSPGSTSVPHGTPVPGNPPGSIAVYKGVGAYLNTNPNALYRFECGLDANKWIQIGQGSTVYNIALWYYPNEGITYQRLDFNLATVVETRALSANSSGYIQLNVDTSAWTPNHHYHLIFTGKSSGVVYCGHFDVTHFNSAEILSPDSHSPQEIERVYRQAGLTPP